ncbi:hypothetical protein [Nonomuraea jabiensis]|uniref:hypothetical protein n=1 Tax=Nonomuraea jabiensis TaxID=882448 RepID=UPI0036A4D322
MSVSEDRPVPPTPAESVRLIGGDRTRAAGLTGEGSAVAEVTGRARGSEPVRHARRLHARPPACSP